MGLFSSKRKVYVFASAYNLAGDEADHPNFLQSITVTAALRGSTSNLSLGEHLIQQQVNGPHRAQRSLFNWAVNRNYQWKLQGGFGYRKDVPAHIVEAAVSAPPGRTVHVDESFIAAADVRFFAEQYILQRTPDLYPTDWEVAYDSVGNTMRIVYEDGSAQNIALVDYDPLAWYLIGYYSLRGQTTETLPVVVRNQTQLSAAPATTGYSLLDASTSRAHSVLNQTSTVVVDDGVNPPTTTTTQNATTVVSQSKTEIWEQTSYLGFSALHQAQHYQVTRLKIVERPFVFSVVDTAVSVAGGVTTTTTTTNQYILIVYDAETSQFDRYADEFAGGTQLYIQKMFPACLGGVLGRLASVDEYFPIIPLRLDNIPIDDPKFADQFAEHQLAFRRATGQSIDTLLDQIKQNPDVKKIDFAYYFHGVDLKSKDKAALEYMYEFFRYLARNQEMNRAEYDIWVQRDAAYRLATANLQTWAQAQSDQGSPLFGTPRPDAGIHVAPTVSELELTAGPNKEFTNRIYWATIDEADAPGAGREGAKKGDYWMVPGTSVQPATGPVYVSWQGEIRATTDIPTLSLFWQYAENRHKRLDIFGLYQDSFQFGGEVVTVIGADALTDPENNSFLVPMHAPSLRKVSLIGQSQIALINRHVVFNAYEIQTIKWWQTGFFKFLVLAVVLIAAPYAIGAAGGAAGGGAGVLGANASVGAAAGFTGTAAITAGAVINALAAAALSFAVSSVVEKILGDTALAAAVSAAISFVLTGGLQNLTQGGSFSVDITELMKADNLLKITEAVSNAASHIANIQAAKIGDQLDAAQKDYLEDLEEIRDKSKEILGGGNLIYDPFELLGFTGSSGAGAGSYLPNGTETLDDFLNRTTMVGSDIVEIGNSMISDFVKINLNLDLPITS